MKIWTHRSRGKTVISPQLYHQATMAGQKNYVEISLNMFEKKCFAVNIKWDNSKAVQKLRNATRGERGGCFINKSIRVWPGQVIKLSIGGWQPCRRKSVMRRVILHRQVSIIVVYLPAGLTNPHQLQVIKSVRCDLSYFYWCGGYTI